MQMVGKLEVLRGKWPSKVIEADDDSLDERILICLFVMQYSSMLEYDLFPLEELKCKLNSSKQ